MKRFASLTTTAVLAGALLSLGSASQAASNTLNMYLVPVTPLKGAFSPGDLLQFQVLVDVPSTGPTPITLTLGATVAYDSTVFDINGLNTAVDTSAYPPKPSVKLWDLVPPTAYSKTVTGPAGVPLDTYQLGVGHTRQITQPGNKVTSIPPGTYTIGTFAFPIKSSFDTTTLYLPTAFGYGGTNSATDFINNTDSAGTNNEVLAFPNDGVTKFNHLTFQNVTPAPSSLLITALGAIPFAGVLRRRAAKK